jgi:glycosyltransferase involved in cell wall biosynthesis
MKKKILFLIQLPGPIHGQSLINKSIKESKLINKKFKNQFINISTTRHISEIELFRFKKILTFIQIIFKLIKSLLIFKPDRIYISLSVLGFGFLKDSILVIISKLFCVKLIFHLHRKEVHSIVTKSIFYKIYYKFIFKNVELIHLSDILQKDIRTIKDLKTKSYVVNNGIKDNSIKNLKKDKIFTFIYISNFFRFKGIHILLKAILLLNKKKLSKKFKVNIIGNFTNQFTKNNLNNFLYENRNFNNVKFFTSLYGKEKFEHLSKSHAMIYPTKNDCFPICLLEAMSCGLPIISTYEGAIPDMIKNHYNGILIKNSKLSTITKVMKSYINNTKILNKYSKNNIKDYKKKYTVKTFERNLTNVLNKSLSIS